MWRQLLDDAESKEESSGTAMFVFALATGVKSGWLPAEKFAAPARSGWLALAGRTDPDGAVRDGCIGTDKGFSRAYYLARPLVAGDLHPQAAVLWAATALLR
jgi:rhamnogalacturonyl hydrolase YesR